MLDLQDFLVNLLLFSHHIGRPLLVSHLKLLDPLRGSVLEDANLRFDGALDVDVDLGLVLGVPERVHFKVFLVVLGQLDFVEGLCVRG